MSEKRPGRPPPAARRLRFVMVMAKRRFMPGWNCMLGEVLPGSEQAIEVSRSARPAVPAVSFSIIIPVGPSDRDVERAAHVLDSVFAYEPETPLVLNIDDGVATGG